MGKCKFFRVIRQRSRKYKVGSYFRELSVVIIGVAVTFYVSGVIESIREQKDVKAQLSTMYDELSYNLTQLEALYNYYATHENIKKQLYSFIATPEKINNDSLNQASRLIGQTHVFVYKRSAYNLFEDSGAMKLFKDKKLLLKISDCYALLERCKENYKEYSNLKLNEIQKLYSMDTKLLLKDGSWLNIPEARGVQNFYLMVSRDVEEAKEKEIQEMKEILIDIQTYID